MYLRVACPGGNALTIVGARINNVDCSAGLTASNGLTIAPQNSTVLTITYVSPNKFLSSYAYTIVITSAKNNEYQTTGMVP